MQDPSDQLSCHQIATHVCVSVCSECCRFPFWWDSITWHSLLFQGPTDSAGPDALMVRQSAMIRFFSLHMWAAVLESVCASTNAIKPSRPDNSRGGGGGDPKLDTVTTATAVLNHANKTVRWIVPMSDWCLQMPSSSSRSGKPSSGCLFGSNSERTCLGSFSPKTSAHGTAMRLICFSVRDNVCPLCLGRSHTPGGRKPHLTLQLQCAGFSKQLVNDSLGCWSRT